MRLLRQCLRESVMCDVTHVTASALRITRITRQGPSYPAFSDFLEAEEET